MRLFGRQRETPQPPAADVYTGLRQQLLQLTPEQLGGADLAEAPILALLLETGYREAVATLVAVVDGTTSLYFSNGGGFIGAGTHAAVADASTRWLETGRTFLPQLAPIDEPPPPSVGLTQFIAVTGDGLHGASAPEEDLGQGMHALSPLFHAGHDVISQIRLSQGA